MDILFRKTGYIITFLLALICSSWAYAQAGISGIPQIPAFLPLSHTVPPTAEAMPLDGVWNITTINKRIRIDRGRAYAVDSWLHLFVLQVQANMVVVKDIVKTGAGEYSGNDLPLLGVATFKASPSGNLDVTVQAPLGPIKYALAPVDLDDRDWFERDRDGNSRVDDEEDDGDQDDSESEDDSEEDDSEEDDKESEYP